MPVRAILCAIVFSIWFGVAPAAAHVVAKVSLSQQRMQVVVDGRVAYDWVVSTGASGSRTPTGKFKPVRMHRDWYSRKYDNAPMPHSIFFYKGYAIHGTNQTGRLGRPASKGCVRLHPQHAAILFDLVKRRGSSATQIVITP